MLLPALFSSIALIGTPVAAASPYEMELYVSGYDRETVFLAAPGLADAGPLPVFRICYDSAATSPAPQILSVHVGERRQMLTRGKCSFFAGDDIELAVWKADGSIRASVTLLR
ncbi:hypothetical protein HNE_2277 [Hyphomonas neptunium ATCC 15444]|uniref:Lipoprotein n=2 Tax=Hyphomonas TaxID=85 RepID=Q0BZX1_HYPNA|nr:MULTISPECIES: hypothetical protein [Hyphomonas]ABI75389.1 hypothetical protein HNE_2277 [Hyphomonas neptunium ATCC 15444]KCZ87857.1 hypothetical protein HHI_15438 [Hyphomonas hirschiana VP5]